MFNPQYNYNPLTSTVATVPYQYVQPKPPGPGLLIISGLIGVGILIGMALGLGLGIGAAGIISSADLLNVTNTTQSV